jgi:superfamily II DNA or RNA helicase
MEALLRAVREACDARTWSRGVELARQQVVRGERGADDGLRLHVAARGLRAARVQLWPDDAGWDCDCDAPADACEHVAAAVIALRQAREQGRDLPEAEAGTAPGHVGYRFRSEGSELALARAIAGAAGQEIPLRGSVAALAAGRGAGPPLAASEADLRIDELLRGRDGAIPPGLVPGLLRLLARCPDLKLDDRPLSASADPVLPRAVLEDRDGGFALQLVPPEGLEQAWANGVLLCAGVLRPRGDAHLGERERRELAPPGRRFAPDDTAQLVAEILPSLARRIPVEIRSARLPRGERERPRLRIASAREGDRLRVRADLVYGTPPRARVEAGRLVYLAGAIPLRDPAAEERLAARLRRELGLEPGEDVSLDVAEALDRAPRLAQLEGAELVGDAAQFRALGELVPALRVRSDDLDLHFDAPGGRPADARAVLRAWQEGASWVALDGGGFASLPAGWLAQHGERVADLLAARGSAGRLPTCALPELARLCQALGAEPPPGLARLRALVDGFTHVPRAALPSDLRAELRPYQREGVDWLVFLRDAGLGALLADDMGLGKTLQALCALRGRSLVVAPTSVLHAWRAQLERFRPGLRCALYHGAPRELDPAADVTLTSWAILRLDRELLREVEWDCAVLDEAQAIKNPDSQLARAAFELRARFRLALTGTPVENRLEELWSEMQFANPGLLGPLEDFRRRAARPIADGVPGAAARLRERIAPFVLRRRKTEVARDLPPRTEIELRCELTPEQREVYDAVRAATRRDVVARLEAGGSVLEALEALLRLRQAACHPGLVPGGRDGRSGKLEVLAESLGEAVAEGHRALVFSQWTSLLDRVEPVLREARLVYLRLDGSTRDRAGVVARFQDPEGPPVLLISLRAGGTGLDLTAADQVYLLDPWWNPAVEDQAADRAHRIGQERPVLITRLVSQDTVEERILGLQSRKRALAEAALGGAERAAAITRDELLALLA